MSTFAGVCVVILYLGGFAQAVVDRLATISTARLSVNNFFVVMIFLLSKNKCSVVGCQVSGFWNENKK